eukprot:3474687-Rhodomonas_salina.2
MFSSPRPMSGADSARAASEVCVAVPGQLHLPRPVLPAPQAVRPGLYPPHYLPTPCLRPARYNGMERP